MRKFLSILLALTLVISSVSVVVFAEGEIMINNAADFIAIGNNSLGSYKLNADIDLTSGYTPLEGFGGTLDGNGHTITVNISGVANAALFANLNGNTRSATFKNLTVAGTVSGTDSAAGFVADSHSNNYPIASFINCVNKANITGTNNAGGFLAKGCADANACVNYGNVDGALRAGGITGWHTHTIKTYTNCANFGNVTSRNFPGGISGWPTANTHFNNCFNAGTVTNSATAKNASAIHSAPADKRIVTNCLNVGSAYSAAYIEATAPEGAANNYYLEGTSTNGTGATAKAASAITADLLGDGWHSVSNYNYPLPVGVEYDDGSKTIASASDFAAIGDNATGTYRLTADITVSSGITGFAGTFDGDGHTVTLENNISLFGNLGAGAVIRNLNLAGEVTVGTGYGPFANTANNNVTFENCINNVKINTAGMNVGGFVGSSNVYWQDVITFNNCVNNADITSSNAVVAGFIAKGSWQTVFVSCVNNGNIEGTEKVSGFAAWMAKSYSKCANFGSVKATGSAGGFIGTAQYCDINISDCVNTGSVTSSNAYFGGFVGTVSDKAVNITNSLNAGSVSNAVSGGTKTANLTNVYSIKGVSANLNGAVEKEAFEITVALMGENWHSVSTCAFALPLGITYSDGILRINTMEDLKAIGDDSNKSFVLNQNIVLDDSYTSLKNFSGTIDGNGCSITLSGKALFENLSAGAVIKNLTLKGNVSGELLSAPLAYTGDNNISVVNCVNEADVSVTLAVDNPNDGRVAFGGGFIATSKTYYNDNISFNGCINKGNISAINNGAAVIGGFVGKGSWNLVLNNCQNYGTLYALNSGGKIAGFVGWMAKEINSCANFGNIDGKYSGAFLGNVDYCETKINDSLNMGYIKGENHGGIVGRVAETRTGAKPKLIATNIYTLNSDKLYSADSDLSNITLNNVYYVANEEITAEGASKVTRDELKTKTAALGSNWTDGDSTIYGFEYPVPSSLSGKTETVTVTITKEGNGTVTPSGEKKVVYNADFIIYTTPNDGYYPISCYTGALKGSISEENGNPIAVARGTKNAATVVVTFVDKSVTGPEHDPEALVDYPNIYEDAVDNSMIKFAKVKDYGWNKLNEYGVLYIQDTTISENDFKYSTVGVKYASGEAINGNGEFGLRFLWTPYVRCKSFSFRTYAKYQDGTIVYGTPFTFMFNEETNPAY